MKKLMMMSFLLVILSQMTMAQSFDDDLYFVPKKEKKSVPVEDVKRTTEPREVVLEGKSFTVYTPVELDASGMEVNVDEYNRRYTTQSGEPENYVEEYPEEKRSEEGEWVNGFEGSTEDYELATRIIRFRSPRVAVPVSSPFYWDIVYTWTMSDWNVYTDGLYAYAFPTRSNPFWWDWHYDPWRWHYGWNWNIGWSAGGFGFHFGWGWNSHWHGHHYWPHYAHHHHNHWHPGGHIGIKPNGWRDGFYYDSRRHSASRATADRAGNRNTTINHNTATRPSASRSGASGKVVRDANSRNRSDVNKVQPSRNSNGRTSSGRTSTTRQTTRPGYTIGEPTNKEDGTIRVGGRTVGRKNVDSQSSTTNDKSNVKATTGSSTTGRSSGYTRGTSNTRSQSGSGYNRTSSTRSSQSNQSATRSSSRSSNSRSSATTNDSYSSGSSSRSSNSSSYSSGRSSRSGGSGYSGGSSRSAGSSRGGGRSGGRR